MSGGSIANWSAVCVARAVLLRDDWIPSRYTIYASDQVHHSMRKALSLSGFPSSSLRIVPTDPESFAIKPDALISAINADRFENPLVCTKCNRVLCIFSKAGLNPFMIVGNFGATNTGACDDLKALASIAKEEKCFFHVDAAYGQNWLKFIDESSSCASFLSQEASGA